MKPDARRRRPEARPDEILDAALAVFSEKGFAAARMEDVAKRAGLSKGAVYLYFDSKEAVFEALVRRFAETVVGAAAKRFAAMGEDDPEAALRTAIAFLVKALADPAVSAAPRLVIAEAQRFPEIAQLYRREVIAVGQRAFEGLLARGVERGVFREVPFDAAKRAFMGPVIVHMILSHVFPDPDAPAPAADADALAAALADLLLNGLRPRPTRDPDTELPSAS